jgi:serine/threonine-protein kinase
MGQLRTQSGEYVLGDLLGSGGMGQVHAARHASGRQVVIKRVRDTLAFDETVVARLGAEGHVSCRVTHPNVVRVVEHGRSADGAPFIVMEHASGVVLRRLLHKEGPPPLPRVRSLAAQLLAGLAAIHDAGIVHADIKSNNVIVDTADGVDHLTIIDFGLARTWTTDLSGDGIVSGTPGYMAPEMWTGAPPSTASDVYAAAVVVYELIVGRLPDTSPFGRSATDAIEIPDDARERISGELERVVLRALAIAPEARYRDARGFAAAFDRAIGALLDQRAAAAAAPRALLALLDRVPRDPVVGAYLSLAGALIAADRAPAAAQALEGALRLLVGPRTPPSLWQLEALLAALHDRLGNSVRARRAAMDAHGNAARAGFTAGLCITRDLLDRVMAGHAPISPRER